MAAQYLDKSGLLHFWGQLKAKIKSMIAAEAGHLVPYGYCTTAAKTAAKTVTVSPTVTELKTGLTIAVKFQNANGVANPTLNVNGLGAKAIKRYGTTAPSTSAASSWNANEVRLLTYDGAYWQLCDWLNTTYSGMSVAEYEAGTETTARLISPLSLKNAVLHWAPVKSVNSKTGEVSLTASDVGALPSDTPIPAAPYVNDSSGNGVLDGFVLTTVDGISGLLLYYSTSDTPVFVPDGVGFNTGAQAIISQIPTHTSQLINNSGFVTASDVYTPAMCQASGQSTTATSVAADTMTQVSLTATDMFYIGTGVMVSNDNGIEVTEAGTYRISGAVYLQGGASSGINRKDVYVRRGKTFSEAEEVASVTDNVGTTTAAQNGTVATPSKLVTASAGDKFYLVCRLRGGSGSYIGKNVGTFLLVERIE